MITRRETPEEFSQIYDLVKVAFQNFGIKHIHNIPDENVIACELVQDALNGISGTADCC
ncbi:MAG: hypothetical protein ACOY46_13940 [Bacillota bacterium]